MYRCSRVRKGKENTLFRLGPEGDIVLGFFLNIDTFSGYPFGPDGLPTPGVFNGFRPPLPTALDPTRPLPPGLIPGVAGGKP